jgi:hypothetical protein
MAEAKSRENWSHTSTILAITANCHRDPKKSKTFTPKDFNPHETADKQTRVNVKDISILKQVFVDKEK